MTVAQQIANSLQLSERYVRAVARTASYRYKVFTIKKADGKSDRTIEQPSKELKLLQRWLVRQVFDPLPTHQCAHAYIKKKSIFTNALVHRRSRYLSRLDLKDFFPSLTRSDVERLLKSNHPAIRGAPLGDSDFRLIGSLVCRFNRLTIGAPSSPTISNKLMYSLDERLSQIARNHTVKYSRYADDLYFSSSQRDVLFAVCNEVENTISKSRSPKLTINRSKTFHTSRKRRMAITGLLITPGNKISVGRELKRKIRALAHNAKNEKITAKDLNWLRGMVAFVASIEPAYISNLKQKYDVIDWSSNVT